MPQLQDKVSDVTHGAMPGTCLYVFNAIMKLDHMLPPHSWTLPSIFVEVVSLLGEHLVHISWVILEIHTALTRIGSVVSLKDNWKYAQHYLGQVPLCHLTLILLVANIANTKLCKKPEK